MDRGLRLRPATAADVPLLLTLIRGLAEYERLQHEVVATEAALERTLFGPTRYAEATIAEWDGEPAGFSLYFHNYSTFLARPGLYLEDLFVKPECRGRGIGRQLLVDLARLAVERGCGRLEWAVLDWNEPARRFYRSLGAEAKKEWLLKRLSGDALKQVAALSAQLPGASR